MFKKIFLCLGLLGIAAQASESDWKTNWGTDLDAFESSCDALEKAIEQNNIADIKSVLDSATALDREEMFTNIDLLKGRSALMFAADHGNKEAFDCLIEEAQKQGVDIIKITIEQNCFPHLFESAVEGGNIEIMEALFSSVSEEERQKLIRQEYDYFNPLEKAACGGNVEVVRWLFERGMDATKVDIAFVLKYGKNFDTLKCLFEYISTQEGRQKFLTSKDRVGNTLLMIAAQKKHGEDIVKWLVQGAENNGIDLEKYVSQPFSDAAGINAKYDEGNVLYAVKNVEVLDCLVNHLQGKEQLKDFLTFRTPWGRTVLMESASHASKAAFERLIEEVKKLEDVDFDEFISAKNVNGWNVFVFAVMGDRPDIVECLLESLLVEKSLELINSKDKVGITVLEESKYYSGKIEDMLKTFIAEHSNNI